MFKEKSKKLNFFFIIICLLQLIYIFHFRSGFTKEVFINAFKANAGAAYSVSKEIIETKNIIQKNYLSDFNLSITFKKDTYLYQRTIEFNYPIRVSENSKNIFFLQEEDIAENCNIVENGKYLKLVHC